MPVPITKFYFAAPTDVKDAANEAAYEAGLTSAAEFLRIALAYLVEHRAMPPEFKGRRAIMKAGRPYPPKPATQAGAMR